eukprot:11156436-Lingulodinium_polyedra.AAC.1
MIGSVAPGAGRGPWLAPVAGAAAPGLLAVWPTSQCSCARPSRCAPARRCSNLARRRRLRNEQTQDK